MKKRKILKWLFVFVLLTIPGFAFEDWIVNDFVTFIKKGTMDGVLYWKIEKVDLFDEFKFSKTLSDLGVKSSRGKIDFDSLLKEFKKLDSSETKNIAKVLKKFLAPRLKGEEEFSNKKYNPLTRIDGGEISRSINVFNLFARLYGKKKSGKASAYFICGALYANAYLVNEFSDLFDFTGHFMYSSYLNKILNGVIKNYDDFRLSKKSALLVFDVLGKITSDVPDIEKACAREKVLIREYAKVCKKRFANFKKAKEFKGRKLSEEDLKSIDVEAERLLKTEEKASEYLTKVFDDGLIKGLQAPYSLENKEIWGKQKFFSRLCREGFDAAEGPNAKSMNPENAAKCLLVNSCPDLVNVAKCIWKDKQNIELTKTLLAVNAFETENKDWPENLEKLEEWFGKKLGMDVYSGKRLNYDPTNKIISSNGPDLKPGTEDDISNL